MIRKNNGKHEVTVAAFLDEVLYGHPGSRRNRLWFLRGPVGSGKTAFINYLITVYGEAWLAQRKLWFVRLDVELSTKASPPKMVSINEFVSGLCKKTLEVLRRHEKLIGLDEQCLAAMGALSRELADTKGYEGQKEAFKNLVAIVRQTTGRDFLLIIDNIDYICHILDRRIYDSDEDTHEYDVIVNVIQLVNLFFHDTSEMEDLGANILFSFRDDSYRLLEQTEQATSHRKQFEPHRVFDVEPPSWDVALERRGELLKYAAQHLPPDVKPSLNGLASAIKSNMQQQDGKQRPLSEHINRLSNFGLRAVMEFFHKYSWLNMPTAAVGTRVYSRLIRTFPVGLIVYLLNGNRCFNQLHAHFPNIYLIDLRFSSASCRSHAHTYWLKRLIAEYVYQKNAQKKSVDVQKVLGVFSPPSGGYEEHLVRECLGSLSEAAVCNMMQATRRADRDSQQLRIESIELNRRGEHCLKHIFDRFLYLQLIVEDYMLPLPRCVFQEFHYPSADYSYLVAEGDAFRDGLVEMVDVKSRQVLLFLEVLDAALACEKACYPAVFERLSLESFQFPRVDTIVSEVAGEVEALNSAHSLGIDLRKVTQLREELRSDIRRELSSAYERGCANRLFPRSSR
ncbi:MAG: hypothetical protein JNK76_22140 [Planctomycetales bacterium]|nr:hypothetical protein [Planctomycetales bacterium]